MKTQINSNKHYLFFFFSLQLDRVHLETYCRLLEGVKDSLLNYKLDKLKITDDEVIKKSGKEFHPIAMKTGISNDMINGTIYEITEEELD